MTVIDRTNHHLFEPLLYQVATALLSVGDVAPAIRDVLRHHKNTRVLLAEVTDIHLASREVHLDTRGRRSVVPYDSLIVAAGATQSYFGLDEFAAHAPGMKTVDDAVQLRGRIFGAFEMAEVDSKRREHWLTFAVVGAGPTGVELAGQIAELFPPHPEAQLPNVRSRGGADRPPRRRRDRAADVPGAAAAARTPGP